MKTSTGRVATGNGAKYIVQLCKHWAHKLEVETLDDGGLVRFDAGTARMTADAEGLTVEIQAEDAEALERLQGVVVRHLDRFAFREAPLGFTWS